jgi:hypothetical protein
VGKAVLRPLRDGFAGLLFIRESAEIKEALARRGFSVRAAFLWGYRKPLLSLKGAAGWGSQKRACGKASLRSVCLRALEPLEGRAGLWRFASFLVRELGGRGPGSPFTQAMGGCPCFPHKAGKKPFAPKIPLWGIVRGEDSFLLLRLCGSRLHHKKGFPAL